MLMIPLSHRGQENPFLQWFPFGKSRTFWPGRLLENIKKFLSDSFVTFPLSFWFIHTFTDIRWAGEHFPCEPLIFCLYGWQANSFSGKRREILCFKPAQSPGTDRDPLGPGGGWLGHLLPDLQAPADIFDVRRISSDSKPALVVGPN